MTRRLEKSFGPAPAVGAIVPGTDHVVTFSGQASTTLSAGSTAQSDPLDFEVSPNTNLSVSIYLPDNTGPVTWNQFGDTFSIAFGNQAGAAQLSSPNTIISRPILSSVEFKGHGDADAGGHQGQAAPGRGGLRPSLTAAASPRVGVRPGRGNGSQPNKDSTPLSSA